MTSAVEHEARARFPRRGHAPASVNLRLGEILVSTGQISERELSEALERKRVSGRLIGEELVAAGMLPPERLVPALKLQRRLAIAALVAALCPGGRGFTSAEAGQTRAYMTVSATVVESVSVRAVYQAPSIVITQQDVQRGYVDVAAGSRFEIKNRGPCVFEFGALPETFRSVRVTGPQAVAEFGASGGSMIQHPGAPGLEQVAVNYRFALAPGLTPGAYAWPLKITVLPM